MGKQREWDRPENQKMAGGGGGQRGGGPDPPRQVAVHDVPPAETAAKAAGRGWMFNYKHRLP